ISTTIWSVSPYRRCSATAREQASPIARRTSSRTSSGTPARRATATPTRRAVRTCTGAGEKCSRTVGIAGLLRLTGRGRLDAGVEREHLVERGDPEDLQQRLAGAHEGQTAPVGAQPLVRADEHPEPGGVEELDRTEIDDHLAGPAVHQLGEPFPQPQCGADVHLAADLQHRVITRTPAPPREL